MKAYKLNEVEYKRLLGRNVMGAENNDDALPLFWGASALEIQVKSTEVWVKFSSDYDTNEPWVAIEVNGFQTSRFMVPKGYSQWFCVARGLNPQKENLITILKDTQPMSGEGKHSLFIHEIGLSEDGVFCPVPQRPLKFEFVGDSITSGEGLSGNPDEMDWISQWMCASKTYAVQVSHAFNADWSMFSQCGWGLCWGWDGNVDTKMPPHYEKVCSVMWGDYQKDLGTGQPYLFGKGSDVVVINLGTNDNSGFDLVKGKKTAAGDVIEEPGKVLTSGAYDFLKVIRKNNPDAQIVWCWGMLKLDRSPAYIRAGIEKYMSETGDARVHALELPDMGELEVLPGDKGSRGHPGPKTHAVAAEKLIELIKTLL